MTLKDIMNKSIGDELEVWDTVIDTQLPYYMYDEPTYEDEKDTRYLHLLEDWLLSLEVESVDVIEGTATVDVYSHMENIIDRDDDFIADHVEDVFTVLNQGYEGVAKYLYEVIIGKVKV